MSAPVAVPCAALLAAVAVSAQDNVARIEIMAPSRAVLEQPVEIAIRFELDRTFFAERAVPLLQRPVDLPVQLTAGWIESAPEHLVEILPGDGPTVALGDSVVRTFRFGPDRYEVRCRWTGLAAGGHALTAALRFAYASAFEETLLSGRQPVDRLEHTVAAPGRHLTVEALPAGAPPGFAGAVGEFAVGLAAEAGTVELGDSFALTLTVTGSGNLMRFGAPPWPELPGFAVQGLVERDQADRRELVFDVLALAEGAAELRLSMPFYSPQKGEYVSARTDPVRVTVVPRSPDRPLSPRVAKLIADRRDAGAGTPWLWLGTALGALAVVAVAIRLSRRRASVRGEGLEPS